MKLDGPRILIASLLLAAALLEACSAPAPISMPNPPNRRAQSADADSKPLAAIQTNQGRLVVRDLQVGDRGPVGCEPSVALCREAKAGTQILTVALDVGAGGGIEFGAGLNLLGQAVPGSFGGSGPRTTASAAHVLAKDGTPVFSALAGLLSADANVKYVVATPGGVRFDGGLPARVTGIVVIFEVPAAEAGLRFVWPGNPPIPIIR